jgi:hypothetical protein
MPESVLIPAPVNATKCPDRMIQSANVSTASSNGGSRGVWGGDIVRCYAGPSDSAPIRNFLTQEPTTTAAKRKAEATRPKLPA